MRRRRAETVEPEGRESSDDGDRLGRALCVDLRQLWPNEERNFAQWLLEHSEVLVQALGMDVELNRREDLIGDLPLDVVG